MKKILFFSCLGNLILVGVIIWGFLVFGNDTEKVRVTYLDNSDYDFINPVLDYDIHYNYFDVSRLQGKAGDYIEEKLASQDISNISYYVQFLNTGQHFGFNQSEQFSPASLMKLPVAISIMDLYNAESLPQLFVDLGDKPATSTNSTRNIGSDYISVSGNYSLDFLIKAMLKDSDNNALAILIKFIGRDKLNHLYEDFGILSSDISEKGDISVKKYAGFFRLLYNSSYLSRKNSEYLLGVLSRSSYRNGLRQGIPLSIPIAHKFGERAYNDSDIKQLHDCGIVYNPDEPFILCIMTRGEDFQKLEGIIQNLSKIIYNEIVALRGKK